MHMADNDTDAPQRVTPRLRPTLHNEGAAYDALQHTDFRHVQAACLEGMCEEIREEIVRHAAVNLSLLLVPRVFLNANKRKDRRVTPDVRERALPKIKKLLKEGELFSVLPEEAIDTLAGLAVPVETDVGDVIIREADTSKSVNAKYSIWCVLDGAGDIYRGSRGGTKAARGGTDDSGGDAGEGTGRGDFELLYRFTHPILVGDISMFTDEPRTATVCLTTHCDCWTLSKSSVEDVLRGCADKVQRALYNRAFMRRQRMIASMNPRSIAHIRSTYLFQGISDRDATAISECLQPMCVCAGSPVYFKGETATCMYFLLRGEARAEAPFEARYVENGDVTTFGEHEFMFDCGKHHTTVRAVEHCDFWVLPYKSLQELMRRSSIQEAVRRNSAKRRLAFLEAQRPTANEDGPFLRPCVDFMRQHTMLGEVCTEAFRVDLARSLQPEVYLPRQNILSAVSACDRVLYFQCGRAAVQNDKALVGGTPHNGNGSYHLRNGDIVGLTLLAFHRWLFPVTALTGCDVWSCDRDTFIALLQRHDLVKAYSPLVRRVLTEHTYLPTGVALGRRQDKAGLMIPPVLHPIPGLAQAATAIFSLNAIDGTDDGMSLDLFPRAGSASPRGTQNGNANRVDKVSKFAAPTPPKSAGAQRSHLPSSSPRHRPPALPMPSPPARGASNASPPKRCWIVANAASPSSASASPRCGNRAGGFALAADPQSMGDAGSPVSSPKARRVSGVGRAHRGSVTGEGELDGRRDSTMTSAGIAAAVDAICRRPLAVREQCDAQISRRRSEASGDDAGVANAEGHPLHLRPSSPAGEKGRRGPGSPRFVRAAAAH